MILPKATDEKGHNDLCWVSEAFERRLDWHHLIL